MRKLCLVCGDGDLSFSASIAVDPGIHLIASVLESEEKHNEVYQDSTQNMDQIRFYGHEVLFQVDATRLHFHPVFETMTFDRIQWNFPHVKGKVNIARNRQLLEDFFTSCCYKTSHIHRRLQMNTEIFEYCEEPVMTIRPSNLLSSTGQIYIALFEKQGGATSNTLYEWDQSWKPAKYAAECANLLLTHVIPFEAQYKLSSYRGFDKPFGIDGQKQLYIFSSPDGHIGAPTELQLYSYFSVYVSFLRDDDLDTLVNLCNLISPHYFTSFSNILHPENATVENDDEVIRRVHELNDQTKYKFWTQQHVLHKYFFYRAIQKFIHDGIRIEFRLERIIEGSTLKNAPILNKNIAHVDRRSDEEIKQKLCFAEYKIRLSGEKYPMTQTLAENIRIALDGMIRESTIATWVGKRKASNVYPTSLLHAQRLRQQHCTM